MTLSSIGELMLSVTAATCLTFGAPFQVQNGTTCFLVAAMLQASMHGAVLMDMGEK